MTMNEKCESQFRRETANENSCLIIKKLSTRYLCKLGIANDLCMEGHLKLHLTILYLKG